MVSDSLLVALVFVLGVVATLIYQQTIKPDTTVTTTDTVSIQCKVVNRK